jgi:pimeloyl-ACP methyl ester carboxylesterase/thioester reductase-like protein
MKTILITAPADPLLSRLAAQFALNDERVVYCQADDVAIDAGGHSFIDEVWHAASTQEPAAHLQATRSLLNLIERLRIPVINYISSAFISGQSEGLFIEGPFDPRDHAINDHEESKRVIESEIVAASERTGLAYRIFRPSIIVDLKGSLEINHASKFYRLLSMLMEFKDEIADKAPDYFKYNAMNLAVRADAKLHLIEIERAAEAAFKIASRTDTLNGYYNLVDSDPARFGDYCGEISDALGIKLNSVNAQEQLNPIDELFHLQAADLIDYLNDVRSLCSKRTVSYSGMSASDLSLKQSRREVIQTSLSCFAATRMEEAARIEAADASLARARITLHEGQVLNYYAGGSGRDTIVIINAYGQSINYWKKLIARLIEKYRVIVWVARGNEHETVGMSQFHPVAVHVNDLERLLANEGVEKCSFIGWCTGPKMILEYYNRHPEKVSTMTFLGPTFKNGARLRSFETSYERTLEPLFAMVNGDPSLAELLMTSLRAVLLGQSGSGSISSGPLTGSRKQALEMLMTVNASLQQFVLEPFSSPQSVINFAGQLLDFWNHDVMPLLPQVRIPALFVSGECDKIASTEMAGVVSKMMPAAKYLQVKGGSHYLQYEKDEMLSEIINRFLAQTSDFEFNHRLVTIG